MGTSKTETVMENYLTPFGDMSDLDRVQKLIGALLFSNAKDRSAEGLPPSRDEAIKLAGEAICKNIKSRGSLFNCDGMGYMLLRGQEGRPIRISPSDAQFVDLLVTTYGVATGSEAEKRIGKYVGVRAIRDGSRSSLRHFFHYDIETETAYISERVGQLVRVTKDTIDRVPNGTGGQLFDFNESYQGYEIDLDFSSFWSGGIERALTPSDSLAKVFAGIEFEPSRLTVEQKKILVCAWIIVTMLPGLIVEKPLLQIIGPSGSGKTSMLELIGRTLFGPEFKVERLTDDTKEFENAIINNDFLALDNTTAIPKKIRALICQTVTGFRVTRRELYTTMGQIQRPSTATLAVAGITKMLNETETSNRSIDIRIKERASQDNISEQELHNETDWQRSELMGELIFRIQRVLKALADQSNYTPTTSLRLAGFASVILRVARFEGWEREAQALLNTWHQDQVEAALEGEDLADILTIWISKPGWKPGSFTGEQLNHELSRIAEAHSMGETSWQGRPQWLGIQLHRSVSSYRRRFGLRIVTNKHTKANFYRFEPTQEQLALIRESDVEEPVAAASEDSAEDGSSLFRNQR